MYTRKIFAAVMLAALAVPLAIGAQDTLTTSERRARDREREQERIERLREQEQERKERAQEQEQERKERDAERRAEARERAAEQRERNSESRDRVRERAQDHDSRLDTLVAFAKGGTVDLGLIAGNIIVRSWTRPEVQIHATLEQGRIESEISSARITLGTRSGRNIGDGRFELQVPVGTRVIARTTSGDIRVTGVKAPVEARSTSGDIEVEDVAGKVSIESVSGDVRGRKFAGDVHAMAVSGDVELDGITGDIQAGSVSGTISLMNATSKDVRVETVSGDVSYDGSIERTGRYEFKAHSGELHVTIPDGSAASLSLETFNGELQSDFPITIQPSSAGSRRTSRRIDFALGGGGARVVLETFSGNITLEKGRKR